MTRYHVQILVAVDVDEADEEAAAAAVVSALRLRRRPSDEPRSLSVGVSSDGAHWTVHRVVLPDMTEEEAAPAVTR